MFPKYLKLNVQNRTHLCSYTSPPAIFPILYLMILLNVHASTHLIVEAKDRRNIPDSVSLSSVLNYSLCPNMKSSQFFVLNIL